MADLGTAHVKVIVDIDTKPLRDALEQIRQTVSGALKELDELDAKGVQ